MRLATHNVYVFIPHREYPSCKPLSIPVSLVAKQICMADPMPLVLSVHSSRHKSDRRLRAGFSPAAT